MQTTGVLDGALELNQVSGQFVIVRHFSFDLN